MINVYKNSERNQKKQYTAIKIRHATAKNGAPYTNFTISDSKRLEDGGWQSEYYTVFVWKHLNIDEKDKIEFEEIYALEVKEDEYNGKKQIKKTIFAEVSVVGKSQNCQVPEDFLEIDSDLPF